MPKLSDIDVKALVKRFDVPIFLETGAGEGDGIAYAISCGFEKIISIEIIFEQVLKLNEKFIHENVHMLYGDSLVLLDQILPKINQNVLFWLDAHYPGADLANVTPEQRVQMYLAEQNDDIRLPLEKELELIKKYRKNYKDVILMDDLTLYKGMIGNAYWLKARQNFEPNFFEKILAETHDFVSVNEAQGMLLPR